MGAQQAKERTLVGTTLSTGASIRASRTKPRVPKDGRLGSNIFTEHNGE